MEGSLPPSEADQLLSLVPIDTTKPSSSQTSKKSVSERSQPGKTGEPSGRRKGRGSEREQREEEEHYALELAKALSASMAGQGEVKGQHSLQEDEQFDIAAALSQSVQGNNLSHSLSLSLLFSPLQPFA